MVTVPSSLLADSSDDGNATTAEQLLSNAAAGSCIIHNAANSALGTAVAQIAKSKGLKVVSVVSEGVADYKKVEQALKAAGSDVVVTEASAGSAAFKKTIAALKPSVAVHCDASDSAATTLARLLAVGGSLVSASGAGVVTVPSSLLIDRGISVSGAGISVSGTAAKSDDGSTAQELLSLVKAGKVAVPVASAMSLGEFREAVEAAEANPNGSVLFTM